MKNCEGLTEVIPFFMPVKVGTKKTRRGLLRVTKRILQFFNQNLHTSNLNQILCQILDL